MICINIPKNITNFCDRYVKVLNIFDRGCEQVCNGIFVGYLECWNTLIYSGGRKVHSAKAPRCHRTQSLTFRWFTRPCLHNSPPNRVGYSLRSQRDVSGWYRKEAIGWVGEVAGRHGQKIELMGPGAFSWGHRTSGGVYVSGERALITVTLCKLIRRVWPYACVWMN